MWLVKDLTCAKLANVFNKVWDSEFLILPPKKPLAVLNILKQDHERRTCMEKSERLKHFCNTEWFYETPFFCNWIGFTPQVISLWAEIG